MIKKNLILLLIAVGILLHVFNTCKKPSKDEFDFYSSKLQVFAEEMAILAGNLANRFEMEMAVPLLKRSTKPYYNLSIRTQALINAPNKLIDKLLKRLRHSPADPEQLQQLENLLNAFPDSVQRILAGKKAIFSHDSIYFEGKRYAVQQSAISKILADHEKRQFNEIQDLYNSLSKSRVTQFSSLDHVVLKSYVLCLRIKLFSLQRLILTAFTFDERRVIPNFQDRFIVKQLNKQVYKEGDSLHFNAHFNISNGSRALLFLRFDPLKKELTPVKISNNHAFLPIKTGEKGKFNEKGLAVLYGTLGYNIKPWEVEYEVE